MTDVSLLRSSTVIPVLDIEEKTQELRYLAAFVAVGLLVSVLSFALTPPALWPEGTVAWAPEMASQGLTVSQIAIPRGLQIAEYSAH